MTTAHSPIWANAEHSRIELVAQFAWIAGEVPFTASQSDCEAHGRDLFTRAAAGEFGAIGAYVAPAPVVPQEVSMRQARRALYQAGLLAAVEAAIAAMPGIEGDHARIDWATAQSIRRDWPLVAALALALGLSDAQLDALFVTAAAILT
jgi:hypothetical protein